MRVLNKPCTVDFDGQRITHNMQVILSERAAGKPTGTTTYDYTEISNIGVSFANAVADMFDYFGFNPLQIVKYYMTNSASYGYSDLNSNIKTLIDNINCNYEYNPTNTGDVIFTDYRSLDNTQLNHESNCPGTIISSTVCHLNTSMFCSVTVSSLTHIGMNIAAISERTFEHDELNPSAATGKSFQVIFQFSSTYIGMIEQMTITCFGDISFRQTLENWATSSDDDIYTDDPNNPYGGGSGTGGGDGSFGDADTTTIEKVGVPDIPNISAITTGLITIYNPSLSAIQSLGNYLWSNNFDIDLFKKLFADPMDAIIGCGIIPVNPTLAGTKNVKIGDIDTGVAMSYLSSQFVKKSMGSVQIKKEVGCFLDYTQTRVHLYLPYIGIRELSTDDVMGKTISVDYNIDCLTGGCAAIVSVDGCVFYQFNGSCIANVPLTAINYSGAIQNAVTGALSLGITGVGMATGAAPLTVSGIAGLASTASNTVFNQKPSVQKSGSMGGAAGLMSVQQPYVIITRPRKAVPTGLNKFAGQTIYMTMNLGTLEGFTMVDQIRLDNIPAMEDEKKELLALLKAGVIF